MRVENLIVEGKCFFPLDNSKQYGRLKEIITEFMHVHDFESTDRSTYFYENKFFTMSYQLILSHNSTIPFSSKIKKSFGLLSQQEIDQKKHFEVLGKTREDLPFMVTFHIIPKKIKDNNGFLIIIRSEPVSLFQMRQLGLRTTLDEFAYSNIIENNKHFINEIMFGLTGGHIIEKPKAIAEFTQTPITDILKNIGYDKVAQLLKHGNLKLERGDIEDGLTDLRGALEQFIKELVEKIDEKPTNNIPSNLDILKKHGYIDTHLHSIIKDTLYDWIYRHISNTSVHKREKINISDAKLLFSVSELIMDHLIEKVVYRR